MTKQTYIKVGGIWKPLTSVHQNAGGVWKADAMPHVRVGGVHKECMSYEDTIADLTSNMNSLGLWNNLQLWNHSESVVLNGSYVSKANDLSDNTNDTEQATSSKQPLLDSGRIKFDGTDDGLFAPSATSIDITGSVTICAWAKSTLSFPSNVYYYYNITGKGSIMNLGYGLVVYARKADVSVRLTFWVRNSAGLGIAQFVTFDPTLCSNWTFVVGVFNGSSLLVYSDANLKDSIATSLNPGSTSDPFNVGGVVGSYHSNDRHWQGYIDDVRVFNTALSASQITSIYNASKSSYGY